MPLCILLCVGKVEKSSHSDQAVQRL